MNCPGAIPSNAVAVSLGSFGFYHDEFWSEWDCFKVVNQYCLNVRIRIEITYTGNFTMYLICSPNNGYEKAGINARDKVNFQIIRPFDAPQPPSLDGADPTIVERTEVLLVTISHVNSGLNFELGMYGLKTSKVTVQKMKMVFDYTPSDVDVSTRAVPATVRVDTEYDEARSDLRKLALFQRFHRNYCRHIHSWYGLECALEFIRRCQKKACEKCTDTVKQRFWSELTYAQVSWIKRVVMVAISAI